MNTLKKTFKRKRTFKRFKRKKHLDVVKKYLNVVIKHLNVKKKHLNVKKNLNVKIILNVKEHLKVKNVKKAEFIFWKLILILLGMVIQKKSQTEYVNTVRVT